MDIKDRLKEEIRLETAEILQADESINIDETIDLFIETVLLPIEEIGVKGISTRLINALDIILVSSSTRIEKNTAFPDTVLFEKYLKKVLFIIAKQKYDSILANNGALAKFISELGLNPYNIQLSGSSITEAQKRNFGEQIFKSYKVRNIEGHACRDWSNSKLFIELQNILVVYLYVTHKHKEALKNVLTRTKMKGIEPYLEKVRANFKKWNSRFVHIHGKEEFKEIPLYAVETDWNKKKSQKREGRIEELRKKLIKDNQNQMIIVGGAGIGKTTTMQYLSYKDSFLSFKIPVYIELKLLTSETTLLSAIREKLDLDKVELQKLFNSGNINLFLDGLNEILPQLKESVYGEIKKVIDQFPDIFILISTRANDYDNEFSTIPVFALQKMNENQIFDFINKNTHSQNVKIKLNEAIKNNPKWIKILGTPLILFMMVQLIERDSDLPDDENKIILDFIKHLYQRELEKDSSLDVDYFHSVFCLLAFEHIDKIGNTNSGFSISKGFELINSKDKNLTLENFRKIANKGVGLNLLVSDEKLLSFAHQSYQETLAADYFNNGLFD